MFESLTERLQGVFQTLGKRGRLRPADIDSALKEIRFALLEADVHYNVVKDLLDRVRVRALGEEVSRALNPTQQVIGIIHEQLVAVLGEPGSLNLTGKKPRTIMLVGLQGSGKTTTAAKLAKLLQAQGERVWLVAADPYRPAAVHQLQLLGQEIDVPVFDAPNLSPSELGELGIASAAKDGASVVIFDTAGRSQLDEGMMQELRLLAERIQPVEVLLVADAMTGQEAVHIAQGFQDPVGISGMILTKMDGDARGGAAISMRAVTGVPIKYIGVGEGRGAIEPFEPSRMASRILGMGDVVGLIQQAQASLEAEQAREQLDVIRTGEFTFDDFAEQLRMVRKLGPFGKLLEMLPSNIAPGADKVDPVLAERQMIRTHAIIQSMTIYERQNPDALNASRKRRIAAGSGTTVQEVNQLMRQFRQIRRAFKAMGKQGIRGLTPGL